MTAERRHGSHRPGTRTQQMRTSRSSRTSRTSCTARTVLGRRKEGLCRMCVWAARGARARPPRAAARGLAHRMAPASPSHSNNKEHAVSKKSRRCLSSRRRELLNIDLCKLISIAIIILCHDNAIVLVHDARGCSDELCLPPPPGSPPPVLKPSSFVLLLLRFKQHLLGGLREEERDTRATCHAHEDRRRRSVSVTQWPGRGSRVRPLAGFACTPLSR